MKELFGIRKEWLLAVIFISGLCSPILMIGLIVVTLLKYGEDNHIKQECMKAIKAFIIFQLIFAVQDIIEYFVALIWDSRNGFINVNNKITYIVLTAQICCYLWLAYKAFYGQTISTYSINKNTGSGTSSGDSNPKIKYCSKCGKEIDEESKFCMGCGNPINQ